MTERTTPLARRVVTGPPDAAAPDPTALRIRAGRDDDSGQLIRLIGDCFAEYPGCILDVDDELPELRAIARAYAARDGRFWVVERAARVIGCVGVVPAREPGGVELQKLYVEAAARRRRLGGRLCELVEDEARRRGAVFVELWSDTRFADAHRLYEKRGYVRGPHTRELHDRSNTIEYSFRKLLG